MVDYMGAIKKPFEDLTTLVIGIVIGIIPIVQLLNTGYGVLTAKKVLAGDKKLMAWDFGKIVDMIIAIIMVIIIVIVYSIPGTALALLGLAGAIGILLANVANPLNAIGAIGTAIAAGGLFLLLAGLIWLVAILLLPMAIMNYAQKNSITAAFDLGTILKKTARVNYLVSLIVLVIYTIILSIVAGIISLIPAVGALIAAGVLSFLLTVTGYSIMAETYSE